MSTCIFCEKIPRIKNSHIVPDFFYKWIKDEGRIYKWNKKLQRDGKWIQSGHRESLLCKNCEGTFNREFEQPCVRFFENIGSQWTIDKLHSLKFPTALRLLVLSVIFRSLFSSDERWNGSIDHWDIHKLKADLTSRVSFNNKIYARILCDDLGYIVQGFVSPPNVVTLHDSRFTCLAFGGMEYIVSSNAGAYQIDLDEVNDRGEVVKVLASLIVKAWCLLPLKLP